VTDIALSEEELSIEVAYLDVVVVCHVDAALVRAANTHQSECLDELTAQCTGTNHEKIDFGKLLLQLLTVNLDLVIVSCSKWNLIHSSLGEGLVDIEMEPLLERRELSCVFDDLLRNNTTEESGHWRD